MIFATSSSADQVHWRFTVVCIQERNRIAAAFVTKHFHYEQILNDIQKGIAEKELINAHTVQVALIIPVI